MPMMLELCVLPVEALSSLDQRISQETEVADETHQQLVPEGPHHLQISDLAGFLVRFCIFEIGGQKRFIFGQVPFVNRGVVGSVRQVEILRLDQAKIG